jgi:hypothetical protein
VALGQVHAYGNGKPPSCELRVVSRRTSVTTLVGDHDLASQQSVMDVLIKAIERPNVIVDLTYCAFIDTTILEVFYATRRAQKPGLDCIELVVPDGDGFINRWSYLTGVRLALETHSTLADALSSVGEAAA